MYLTSMNLWLGILSLCEMGEVEDFVKQWKGKGYNFFDELIAALTAVYGEGISSVLFVNVQRDMQTILSQCKDEYRDKIKKAIDARAENYKKNNMSYKSSKNSRPPEERATTYSQGQTAATRGRPPEGVDKLITEIEHKRKKATKLQEESQINKNSILIIEAELRKREAALRKERADFDDLQKRTREMEAEAATLTREADELARNLSHSLDDETGGAQAVHRVPVTETPRDGRRKEAITSSHNSVSDEIAKFRAASHEARRRVQQPSVEKVPSMNVPGSSKPDGMFCGIHNGRGGE